MPNIRLKRYTGAAWEEVEVQTDWGQILNKPSTFTPTSHTHGNILNNGSITSTTVTPADQDRILIADNSNSGSIERGIIIGTGTTTFLRNDGTWASPAGGGDVVGPASSTTGNVPQFADTTGKLINGGKAINDSSSAAAISTGTNLVTERDIYYGLPTINNSHAYTSSTTLYAPTTGQTSDYLLAGNGTTSAPVWRFNKAVWETADQSLTAATNVLSISIPAAGTYKVFMSGAYYSTSTTIGVQVKFTYSGTLSTTPDSSFNITVSLNNAASSGDFHNEVPMNTAVTSTSVAVINTNHGMSALGQFTTTTSGTFSLNIAPETGSTSVGVAEGTLLHVEQVI